MGQKDGGRSDERDSDDLSRQELEKGADLSSLLDVRPEGLVILNHEGRVTHANAAAARILGIPEPDLIGLSFTEHPWKVSTIEGDPFAGGEPPFLRRIRDRKAIREAAFSILHGDGSRRMVSIRAASASGKSGSPPATAILLSETAVPPRTDPSGIRNGEMESFALLVGGIGNDFNNILTAIMGNTSLAKIDVDSDGEVHRTLNYIEKASMRAKDLAQRLLDLSRSRASRRKPAALGALVKEALGRALAGTSVGAELRMPEDIPPVEIDYGRIRQALVLALRHAAGAAHASHLVRVSLEQTAAPDGSWPLPAGRDWLKIAIQAEGEAGAPVVDDPGAAAPDGEGPALETARAILIEHDGRLEVEAGPASTFTVSLYLPVASVPAVSKMPASREIIHGTGRVLVMDDEEMVREVLGKMLGRLGYAPSFAADGAEALALYRQALGSGRRFDAVLMDLTVPGGMGGRETMTELLKLDAAARVVVSTGFSTDPILSEFKRHGFMGAVCKPYEITELSHTIHAALNPEGR